MFYQLNLFDDYDIEDIHYCSNCEHYQSRSATLGYCYIGRCYLTQHSYDWLCAKNNSGYSQYKRRLNKSEKNS